MVDLGILAAAFHVEQNAGIDPLCPAVARRIFELPPLETCAIVQDAWEIAFPPRPVIGGDGFRANAGELEYLAYRDAVPGELCRPGTGAIEARA